MTNIREEIKTIMAGYAVWAGNDITTENFKRSEDQLANLFADRLEKLREPITADVSRTLAITEMNNKIQDLIYELRGTSQNEDSDIQN